MFPFAICSRADECVPLTPFFSLACGIAEQLEIALVKSQLRPANTIFMAFHFRNEMLHSIGFTLLLGAVTLPESFNHAHKHLQFAIDTVSGPGDLKEKLCNAFKGHLLLLRPDDFPPGLRQDFAALINEFCRSGIHKYGINCDRSQYFINERQSVGLVGKIIALHMQLITYVESQSHDLSDRPY